MNRGEIQGRAAFDLIRYANCWEDAEVLCAALRPGPGRRILSIASGGDNSFALLAHGAEVVAADLSPAQLALVELKRAAFRRLDHPALLAFLGARPGAARRPVYDGLRPDLPPSARAYWDANPEAIEHGVLHAGKFERYFRLFRTRVLPLVHSRREVERLLAPRDEAARVAFHEQVWANRRYRLLFRIFFSRLLMGRLGRDPEFFRYVEGSVADRIYGRTRHALTALPTHDNPYLEYILTGGFDHTLPLYLRPEWFEAVRGGLDRLTLFEGRVQDAAAQGGGDGFDGYNLSDVFEYLDADTAEGVYADLLAQARPGARFAYWNMLVPRRRPEVLADRVRSLDDEAQALFARDQAFFYSAFVLEEAV